jgi:hypothetical protein
MISATASPLSPSRYTVAPLEASIKKLLLPGCRGAGRLAQAVKSASSFSSAAFGFAPTMVRATSPLT